MEKLQKVQNAAARLVVRKRKSQPIRETMKELHWSRIEDYVQDIAVSVHVCDW